MTDHAAALLPCWQCGKQPVFLEEPGCLGHVLKKVRCECGRRTRGFETRRQALRVWNTNVKRMASMRGNRKVPVAQQWDDRDGPKKW